MSKLIFFGCLSKEKYKSTCENAKRIITYLDKEYQVFDDVPCCGSLAYHISTPEELKKHIQFVNEWFKEHDITEIVTICAGCYNYLSRYYKEYLGEEFDIEIKHLLQFINIPKNLEKLDLKHNDRKFVVAYHDPCHLRNALTPIIEEPRNIINSIEGKIKLNEMDNNKQNSLCCGSGGGVYSSYKENSDFSTALIFKQAKKQYAKVLITPCPFCFTALKRIKEENRIKTPVLKFEDFLIKLIDGEVSF